jgi:ribosomal protein S18 acetylase RimI-like enzyme
VATEDGEENGEIVAYAYAAVEERNWAELRDRCGRLHDIFVVQRARRQGLAKDMLRECVRRLAAHNVPLVVTTTAWQNEASQALVRSLGFRPTALELAMDVESPNGSPARVRAG